MKTENVFIQTLNREIVFHIGKNQYENFDIIDNNDPNDIWFHAKDDSSCHVVCKLPNDIEKRDLRYIIKIGALLCKTNTNKLKNIINVPIIYTKLKNITKTEIVGCVKTQNTKTIIC
jgi:predicted ribosome quality control (RQC) complex YloA/Tae2 family protein